MSIRLELLCININDPSTNDCYSMNDNGIALTADDTQADVARQYKLLQERAPTMGWRLAKLEQSSKGWLCPNCVVLYEEQTGHKLG